MKNKWRKIISLVLTALFLLYFPCFEVTAASEDFSNNKESGDDVVQIEATIYELPEDYFADKPSARTMLINCFILINCSEEGIIVDFSTGSTQKASVLGVKDIKVQKKVWYGWKTVAESDGAEVSDRATMGCSILVTGVELNETYRILCTHYGNVDEYIEGENNSGEFVYKY